MSLWSSFSINFMLSGMAKNNVTYKTIAGIPNDHTLQEIMVIYYDIFNTENKTYITERFQKEKAIFSVLSYHNSTLIGFKIGYKKNDATFYSWLGGVTQNYRRLGVAKQLAFLQENYAKASGYKTIQTKSTNRFKPMIFFNLKQGFDIKNTYCNTKNELKIVFEKKLN